MTTMTGATSAMKADLNLAELIVLTLKKYGQAVPKEYLARVLSQQPENVNDYLNELQQKHIVRVSNNDMVELVSE